MRAACPTYQGALPAARAAYPHRECMRQTNGPNPNRDFHAYTSIAYVNLKRLLKMAVWSRGFEDELRLRNSCRISLSLTLCIIRLK
jgi:hypothetical protein